MEQPEKPTIILLIDDDPMTLELLEDSLGDRGFWVNRAADAKEGVDMANKERPDLIVCDYLIPEGTGLHVHTEVRKSSALSSVPILFISGAGQELRLKVQEIADKDPLSDFLPKPLSPQDYLKKVRTLLEA